MASFVAIGSSSFAADGEADGATLELFKNSCFECHSDGFEEGEVALDQLLNTETSQATHASWQNAWEMVRNELMPPVDSIELSASERKQLADWIAKEKLGVNFDTPDPGRVTSRRLNRIEYQHTVNDLFGKKFKIDVKDPTLGAKRYNLSDMLPPDDTAHGFDNNGDFLTLSPTLFEKYFELAENITDQLIVTEEAWYPRVNLECRSEDPQEIQLLSEIETDERAYKTAWKTVFKAKHKGSHRVEAHFQLGGWEDHSGTFDIRLHVKGEVVDQQTIDVGGEESYKLEFTKDFEVGDHPIVLSTVGTQPAHNGRYMRINFRPKFIAFGPIDSDEQLQPKSHQEIFFAGLPPEETEERQAYAKAIIEPWVTKAFRRPADPKFVERLANLAMKENNFQQGIANAMVAILTSQRFLYRFEIQPTPDDPTEQHQLDEYELASRLSYLIWLSMPDEELYKAAAENRLRDELPKQITRMLADPKSSRFAEDFAGQWLRTRNIESAIVDKHYDFNRFRQPYKRETDLFFEHIMRTNCDLLELITADYTFLNGTIANLYGIEGVEGNHFRQVQVSPESHRGGLLGQASFLVSTSNPDRTSPVKRGLFVLENLLATQPPPPPAAVAELESSHEPGKRLTVRELLEKHREDPACASCHAHFDPIGLVLENYNQVGMWREQERGQPIDPSSETVTGETLNGVADLKQYLVTNKKRFYRCCVEKLMIYALGRGLEPYDFVTVDRIAEKVEADGGKFSTLLLEVVNSPAFQSRRGDKRMALPPMKIVEMEPEPLDEV